MSNWAQRDAERAEDEADRVAFLEKMVDDLNEVCEQLGCIAGSNRIEFLRELAPELAEYRRRAELNPLSGMSWSGFNVWGDEKSMAEVRAAVHSHSQIEWFRTNLRQWRDEAGKLHAKFGKIRSILGYPVSTEIKERGWDVKHDEDTVTYVMEEVMKITGGFK